MHVKTTYLVLLLIIVSVTGLKSQNTDVFGEVQSASEKGKIQIVQNENLKLAFHNYAEIQKKSLPPNGFRICIFADTGQEAKRNAENSRSKFLSRFEDIKCYTTFKYPWYRVYVGDFRTKSETVKYLKIIEREFPGAYYVPENISTDN